MSRRRLMLTVLLATVCAVLPRASRADGIVPQATELPQTLTLDEAERIFKTRGLELLIADANVKAAEGSVQIAGAVPNPVFSGSVGWAPTYTYKDPSCDASHFTLQNPSATPTNYAYCGQPYAWTVGISDSAALEDSLSGKRDLRFKVQRNALAAAKLSRVDAERTLLFQVRTAYLAVAQAVLDLKFAKDVAASNVTLLEKIKTQFTLGKSGITDADVARMETQKSEGDQQVNLAEQNVRQARVALAFLLGVRGEVQDFDVDTKVLDFSVPSRLASTSEVDLLRTAFNRRPDLIAAGYSKLSADAAVELVRRQKFPDVALSLAYAQGGYGGTGTNGPTLGTNLFTAGASAPLPVFYQLQGETKQAEAAAQTNALMQAMTTKQVVSDVDMAYAAFEAGRQLVGRMEKGEPEQKVRSILESAKVALDITRLQYEKGAASLTDYLLALQTYIATKVEYYGDLTSYWTAVFQLEEATATGLRQ
jgi:outer membrane protein, heavy metal efflux system